MSRPSSTPSFEDGPSFDSGIGINVTPPKPTSEPSQVAFPDPVSPLNPPRIPYNNHTPHQAQSTQNYSRHISSSHSAFRRLQPKSADQDPSQNSLDIASTPAITLNGRLLNAGDAPLLRRPQTPYPLRKVDVVEHNPVSTQNIERVLGPPKRRKTPTLMSAPKLQWDLTRPFLITPSTSTLGSRVSQGEEEDGIEIGGTRVERAGTPIPECAHVRHEAFRQHHCALMLAAYTHVHGRSSDTCPAPAPPIPDASTALPLSLPRASSPCPSHIPTLLKTLDATLSPQPHRLSPLSERSEPLTEILHPGPDTARPGTHPLTWSCPRPGKAQKRVPAWRSGLRNQAYAEDDDDDNNNNDDDDDEDKDQDYGNGLGNGAGIETGRRICARESVPSPFLDTHSLRTAQVLPVMRVTHHDVRRGRIVIPRPHRAAREVAREEGIGVVRKRGPVEENRGKERGRKRKGRSGGRVRRVWERVKGWFCKKGRGAG